jgi:hypothetical protein
MKTSAVIFIGVLAVIGAYVLGRYLERLAMVQRDVGEIKLRLAKLEDHKMRREVRWEWLVRIASYVPIVKDLLIHTS